MKKFIMIFVSTFLILGKLNANPQYSLDEIERQSRNKIRQYENEVRSYEIESKIKKYEGEAKKRAERAIEAIKPYKKEVAAIKVKSFKKMDSYVKENSEMFGIEKGACGSISGDIDDEYQSRRRLVFISESMGQRNIEEIIRQAKIYRFKPVMRGFKDGSYIETAKYLSSIIEKTGYGVEIDPESFKEFDVKIVPSFVVVEGDEYDKISGNLPFGYVLKKFEKEGSQKKENRVEK